MKILLVNPYIYDFTAFDLWLRPLGLSYIAAALQKHSDAELYWLDALDRFQTGIPFPQSADGRGKFQRQIVKKPETYETIPRNYSRYGMPWNLFQKKLDQFPQMDFILITTLMTYWIDGLNAVLRELKKRFSRAKIVVGGVLPTLLGEEFAPLYPVDWIVGGYGEKKIVEIVIEQGAKPRGNPDFSNPDQMLHPAHEFFSDHDHLPLLTSRGCPYRCSYCGSRLLNLRFWERSAVSVVNEIRHLVSLYGTRHFILFDDALLVNRRERFMQIFGQLVDLQPLCFHAPNGLHAGEIDDETAALLFNSGFKMIRLGFESVSQRILDASSEKIDEVKMNRAVAALEKSGYRRKEIEAYLFFGYPGQTIEEVEASLAYVKDLGVIPRLSLFSPVPGTDLYRKLQEDGILADPINPYETNKIFFLFAKSGFSSEEISFVKNRVSDIVRENSLIG